MNIYPSILELSKEAFEEQFERVLPHFSHFQIDIADGIFVPHRTAQIENLEFRIQNSEPVKTFEFHLMVSDWEQEIPKIEQLSPRVTITRVLIHLSVFNSTFLTLNSTFNRGLVVNPEDDISQNWEILKTVDTIQIMTIHPGAQGSPFIPETLTKIDQLRERGFSGKIILDGGINDQTLPLIMQRECLPDAVCPGSYFTKDVAERFEKLTKISQTG